MRRPEHMKFSFTKLQHHPRTFELRFELELADRGRIDHRALVAVLSFPFVEQDIASGKIDADRSAPVREIDEHPVRFVTKTDNFFAHTAGCAPISVKALTANL